jgi:hypothetical protein
MLKVEMRTTINLDDDILDVARTVARAEQRALGAVVSELVRRGIASQQLEITEEHSFPYFVVPFSAPPITDEMVEHATQ